MYDYDENKYNSLDTQNETSNEHTQDSLGFDDDLYNDLWAPYEDDAQSQERD